MDNVEYLSSADLLLYLQNVCEGQEDIPAHDKELDIATLVGDGTPQEIQYVIDLCRCIEEFEEEEQIKATDKLIAYLLNSPIIDDADVLEQAIELSAELYRDQSVARDGNLLTYRANNYAKALGHRYWQQGIREDLNESIRLSEEAVAASSQAMFILSSPIGTIQQQPGLEVHALSTLAARLDELFQLTGSLESLDRSINIMESLIAAVHGPDWEASRAEWLGNLAASIQRRYEQNEGDSTEDIDRAIQISREALQMMDGNDARRPLMLCTLANALGGRAFATDETDNLDEAVRLLREARDTTPTKDASDIEVGYNLALRLFQRHAASDVNEAVSVAESILEYTHDNHPIRPHLQNLLGALHYEQYTKGVSKEGALKVLEISWEALRSSHCPSVLYRVQAGRRILHLCCEMQNWLAAYEAAIATIELIPKLSMREIRNSDRQRLLSKDDVAGFSSDAAAAALNAGKGGFEVIRLLEMGRGSLASSVAELRKDLTSLKRGYPKMAEQFIELRDQLQISSPGQHHVSQEFDALLSVIRQKPGFEDFLTPPGDQNILDAAADGPIIMLNQSEYRSGVDAILIERDNVRIMNLRVSLEDMNMPFRHLQDKAFLERLWDSVAKPILDGLGIGLPPPGTSLPRIWWIPTGALSRLPFHAAGRHFAPFADSVIDRVVSSYSSSIKALLEARTRSSWLPQPSKDNAVPIGMSNTPGCSTTEYSYSSSAMFSMREEYILALSDDLFRGIGSSYVNEEAQTEISIILPELLQAFALKVGHGESTPMHRDVMTFVHKNRREIATAFTRISSKLCEEDLEVSKSNSDSMSLQERMSLWEKNEEFEMVSVEEHLEGHSLEDTSFQHENWETESNNRLLAYREFIPSTEAYEWLLTRLRREFCLIPTEPNTIQAIRARVMSLLSSDHRISRMVSSQSYSVKYELDWHILGFFESQGYSNRPDQVLEDVVTLTGSCQDAQAATCDQYVRQTWPLTGEMMVQLLKEVLQGRAGQSHLCELPDGTTIIAWINGSILAVEVSGVAISIAEAGEQLAWLGAALRTSPRQTGIVYCTPMITNILQNDVTPSQQLGCKKSSADITCEIAFKIEEVPHPLSTANGQCWHDIFKNPVIVRGYPIPRRPQWRTGLEIPLNIMAGLVQTQRVDQFDDKIYIKGFAIMLVPSQRIEDILYWHLVYNKDGNRISYLDDNLDQEKDITRINLEHFRHVLGWCSEANFYAGSNLADRTRVGHSGLPKPHAGCALVNKFVSAGRIIPNGPSFDLGTKDKPFQATHGGYIPLLQWMATKFVLLWDENDKRGWIINGTSALLHVVRASLAHDKNGDFSSAFLFESLEESHKPDKANSAIHVLINRRNLNLKLYHEHDGHILLGSRIEYFCNILEKLIDHQAKLVRDCGGKWSDKPRKYLEGWDFEDLARKRDPLYPRVATLEAGGKAWVDLTRSIQAITLFGRGFGDIIRPSVVDFCHHWAELPTKQYYVAVCLSDLREVIKEHGSHADGLVRLGDDLIWHTSTPIFGTCQCKRDAFDQDHCEPVQSIFPSALSATLGPRMHVYDEKDENEGALIFGHNSNFPWGWGDVSHPQEGALQEVTPSSRLGDADANSFHDSGIGSTVSEGRASASGVGWMKSLSDPCEDNAMLGSVVPIDRYSRTNYTVGIICALSKELKAVRALFDKIHQKIDPEPGDSNTYALGQMAQHMVVAACLPFGEYGTNSAAVVASNMVRSFPLKFCLLVGIGGCVPSEENDIRLGDVVVGLSRGEGSSVIQYDLGKENNNSLFKRTGTLQGPPRFLTTTINVHLLSDPNLPDNPLSPYLDKISAFMSEYRHPGKELDVRQQRDPRPTMEPRIHYGPIASGNRVVKNAAFRDRVASENGAICFEMEAAGVVNTIPSLVIRGICDYCDAEKNDCWQEYAAAAAAAYSKLLLSVVARVEDISPSRLTVGFKRQRLQTDI